MKVMMMLERQAETAWMSRGACFATHLDFLSDDPTEIKQAKQVCATCPVRNPCLAYAKTHHEYGVWGGTDEGERQWNVTVHDCLACGGPLVPVNSSQEQCLGCHQLWSS